MSNNPFGNNANTGTLPNLRTFIPDGYARLTEVLAKWSEQLTEERPVAEEKLRQRLFSGQIEVLEMTSSGLKPLPRGYWSDDRVWAVAFGPYQPINIDGRYLSSPLLVDAAARRAILGRSEPSILEDAHSGLSDLLRFALEMSPLYRHLKGDALEHELLRHWPQGVNCSDRLIQAVRQVIHGAPQHSSRRSKSVREAKEARDRRRNKKAGVKPLR